MNLAKSDINIFWHMMKQNVLRGQPCVPDDISDHYYGFWLDLVISFDIEDNKNPESVIAFGTFLVCRVERSTYMI